MHVSVREFVFLYEGGQKMSADVAEIPPKPAGSAKLEPAYSSKKT